MGIIDWGSVGNFFSSVGDGIASGVNNVFSDVKDIAVDTFDFIADTATAAYDWTVSAIDDVGGALSYVGGQIADTAEAVWAWGEQIVNNTAEATLAWGEQAAKDIAEFGQEAIEGIKKVGSTIAVGATSVISGIAKIGEGIVDGATWLGGGASSLLVSIFNKDLADTMRSGYKGFIARDLIQEANDSFYQGTSVGRAINNSSYLKYDSEVAQKITSVSKTVGEIAIATAATIVTGGAAAPFLIGMAYGLGKAAESTYQTNGTDTTVMQELMIGASGALTGLSWMANGKLGAGALQIGKEMVSKGAGEVLTGLLKEILTKDFWSNALKNGLSLKTINSAGKSVVNVNAIMNYVSSAFGTAQSVIPYINGEEQFDATAALKIGGTYLKYLGLNLLEDTLRDYVSDFGNGTLKVGEELTSFPPSYRNVDDMGDWADDFNEPTAIIPPKGKQVYYNPNGKLYDPASQKHYDFIDSNWADDFNEPTAIIPPKGKQVYYNPNGKSYDPLTQKNFDLVDLGTQSGGTRPSHLSFLDTLDSQNEFTDKQISFLAGQIGASPDEVRDVLNLKINEFFDEGEFGCRVSIDTLEKITTGDGMLKNQFETGTSGGCFNPELRKKVEESIFSVPLDLEVSDRPVYGMMLPSVDSSDFADYVLKGPGHWYGGSDGVVLIFDKNKVSDFTTYTIGDSLDYMGQHVAGGLASNPKFLSGFDMFASGIYDLDSLKNASLADLFHHSDQYLELQFHGAAAHSISNVSEVIFTRELPSSSVLESLISRGIRCTQKTIGGLL